MHGAENCYSVEDIVRITNVQGHFMLLSVTGTDCNAILLNLPLRILTTLGMHASEGYEVVQKEVHIQKRKGPAGNVKNQEE